MFPMMSMPIYSGEHAKNVIHLQQGKNVRDGKVTDMRCKGKFGLVKFYMPGCPGCIGMEDTIVFLANQMKKYDFAVCVVNVTEIANREIVNAVGGVPYVPYICMFKPDGRIFSVENELGGSHGIQEILVKISEVTSQRDGSAKTATKTTKSKRKSKVKTMKTKTTNTSTCALKCDVKNDKIVCKKDCQ
jgi:hypothetical protein